MAIGGIGLPCYLAGLEMERTRRNNSGTEFSNKIADAVSISSSGSGKKTDAVLKRDYYAGRNASDIYDMSVYTRKDISASQELKLPIETERYKIADASYMEGVPAYEIVDKLTGKTLYMREDHMAIQKDEKTGMEFLINMDLNQPLTSNVLMTGELKNILNDLSEKRNIDIKEIPLQGGLVVNHDPKTGLNYLSISGNEAKGVSVILTSKEDIETLNKIVDEFQKYAVSSQRSTAGLYALLEISGNLKREGEGFTYLTPNGITYIPYDGDSNKAWEIDMPSSCYSTARKYVAVGNACIDLRTWTQMLQGINVYYGDLQKVNPYKVDDLGRYCTFWDFMEQ